MAMMDYMIGSGRDKMRIFDDDALSEEEIKKFGLDAQEQVHARSIPGAGKEFRKKYGPKPEPAPAPIVPAVRYTTLEEVGKYHYGVEETKKVAHQIALATCKGLITALRKNVHIPFKARLDNIEEKQGTFASAERVAESQTRIDQLEKQVEALKKVITVIQRRQQQ